MIYRISGNKIYFWPFEKSDLYTQRNNQFKWHHPKNSKLKMDALSMCNTTSIIGALDYLGFKFPSGKYAQPEDNLTDFIFHDREVLDYYKRTMPALYNAFERGDTDAYCPNLIHAVLAFATNKWLGTSAATFRERVSISEILQEVVLYNRPVVMSGTFPYTFVSGARGTLGHINILVGVVYNVTNMNDKIDPSKDMNIERLLNSNPESFIIDDPFGDYKQNFKQGTGKSVICSYSDFIRYYKGLNDVKFKMAHTYKNGAALV